MGFSGGGGGGGGIPTPVSIANGGTGGATAAAARTNLAVTGKRSKVWTVDKSGNNLSSIAAAIALAADGDAIEVAPGAYSETTQWDLTTKSLTFLGAGSEVVEVSFDEPSADYGAVLTAAQKIRGMTLLCGNMGIAGLRLTSGSTAPQRFEDLRIDATGVIGIKDETDTHLVKHEAKRIRAFGSSGAGTTFSLEGQTPWKFEDVKTESDFAGSEVIDLTGTGYADVDLIDVDDRERSGGALLRANATYPQVVIRGDSKLSVSGTIPSIDFAVDGGLRIEGNPELTLGKFGKPFRFLTSGSSFDWYPGETYPGSIFITGSPTVYVGEFGGGNAGLVPSRTGSPTGQVLKDDGSWGDVEYENVVDLQATGTDAENGDALIAAINSLPANTCLRVHQGSYGIRGSAGASNANANIAIVGVGRVSIYPVFSQFSATDLVHLTGSTPYVEGLRFFVSDFNKVGLRRSSGSNGVIRDCEFEVGQQGAIGFLCEAFDDQLIAPKLSGNAYSSGLIVAKGTNVNLTVQSPVSKPRGSGAFTGGATWWVEDGARMVVNGHRHWASLAASMAGAYARVTGTSGNRLVLNDCSVDGIHTFVYDDSAGADIEINGCTPKNISTYPLRLAATSNVVLRDSPFDHLTASIIPAGAVVESDGIVTEHLDFPVTNQGGITVSRDFVPNASVRIVDVEFYTRGQPTSLTGTYTAKVTGDADGSPKNVLAATAIDLLGTFVGPFPQTYSPPLSSTVGNREVDEGQHVRVDLVSTAGTPSDLSGAGSGIQARVSYAYR